MTLKSTPLSKILFVLILFVQAYAFGQEVVVVDSTGVASGSGIEETATLKVDSTMPFKKYKAEGVSAVIGEYVILDSDIDKSYVELQSSGVSIEDITRCQLMGKLMEDKLYLHQAKQDSIDISDAEINPQVDQLIQYMISEVGSEEKVVKYYRKDNMADLRKDLFKAKKEIELSNRMQSRVVENIEITPEEVREFFYAIPEDERPFFSAEVEVAQIVIEPEISEQIKQDVLDKLEQMREDVMENGSSFATKAVLYSKDPGSASRGGLYESIKRNGPMAKEFKDNAFSLLEGEISEPFETDFGYHILMVEKIRGQEVDVRHVLLFPEVAQATINLAENKLDTLRTSIIAGTISFADAARKYSDEKETRNNGGQLVNPTNFDTRFDLTKMDPALSAQVYNLKEGEVSEVFTERDRTGRSKFKVLSVTKKIEEHPADYVRDYEKIQELALKQKQIRAIEAWQKEKIQETYVNVNEDYRDCEYASNWVKK
ncbi:MAG: peptidyl-prolyl cis-trans isomerase SurA [Sediminicola sp.]|jgi:peptidyl-prolyl cis-trans isomerase SurA